MAVVSERFVRRHFAGDPGRALDARLKIWGQTMRIIGVVPGGFGFPGHAEVAFGSHVLHTVMLRRYALAPGAEHEFPSLVIGPSWKFQTSGVGVQYVKYWIACAPYARSL